MVFSLVISLFNLNKNLSILLPNLSVKCIKSAVSLMKAGQCPSL